MMDYEIKNGVAIIPQGTKKIGDNAFYGCTDLTSIVIPASVTNIEDGAFKDCSSLTSIVIPEGVTKIGAHAFHGCTSLTDVIFPKKTVLLRTGVFEGCTSLENFVIPESVKEIEPYVFHGCTSLKNIVIPKNVTKIGFHAFYGCPNLDIIVVDAYNKVYDSREDCNAIIETESNVLLTGGKATIIPKSVSKVGFYAFSGCTHLTNIVIPASVTNIEDGAFYGCTNLTSIVIPASVTNIEDGAFYGCTSLKSVTMPTKVLKINEGAFAGCTSLACITIPTPPKNKGVCKIAERVFEDCCGLKSITIPDNVTAIGRCAFAGCTGLVNITIPGSVTVIDDGAFYGCTGLQTVTIIGNSLKKIGRCAFNGCTNLQNLTIPLSVREIGRYAFEGCANISIPAGVKVEGAPTYRHPYTTTIDSRLAEDLKYLYNNGNGIGEIKGAKDLNGIIATQSGQTSFATKAIPSYGGGKRGAKTVMVMLNPGEDVANANANLKRDLCKRGMKDLLDINAYNEFNAHYGNWDKNRQDAFDLKQAFFLRDWQGTGINLPEGLRANSSLEDKLVAKERVLDEKQQLELIPYASRKFDKFNPQMIHKVFPYVDLLLEEIFSADDRQYVIFCSAIFEEVLKAYSQTNGKVTFVDGLKRGRAGRLGNPQKRVVQISYTNKKGEHTQQSLSCTVIELAYKNKKMPAIIANTFPKQDITNAYEVMSAYGKFCYECYCGMHSSNQPHSITLP